MNEEALTHFEEECTSMTEQIFSQGGTIDVPVLFFAVTPENVMRMNKDQVMPMGGKTHEELHDAIGKMKSGLIFSICPLIPLRNDQDKLKMVKIVQKVIEHVSPEAVCLVIETFYMAIDTKNATKEEMEEMKYIKPSQSKNRKEAIMLNFQTKDMVKTKMIEILRPAGDEKAKPILASGKNIPEEWETREKCSMSGIFDDLYGNKEEEEAIVDAHTTKRIKDLLNRL